MSEENRENANSQALPLERAENLMREEEAVARWVKEGAGVEEASARGLQDFGSSSFPEQTLVRIAKRDEMLDCGQNPYPVELPITSSIKEVREKWAGKLEKGAKSGEKAGVAGRAVFIRNSGGLCFVELQDGKFNSIQIMISKKEVGPDSLAYFKQMADIGDFIFAEGEIVNSNTGELSIMAEKWQMASKALRPLPVLHKDLSEEQRTRKPYVALIVSREQKNTFEVRAKTVSSLRARFAEKGYIEAETPLLQTIHGGASAKPFVTHMNAMDMDLYLRIAPELFLKRLLVGGVEKVFEINRNFRNEGIDATHAPEFTALEAYQAFGTYKTMADLTEHLIKSAAKDVFGSEKVTLKDGSGYDFGGEWEWMDLYSSLSQKLGEEITPATSQERLSKIADRLGIEKDAVTNHGKLVEQLWEHFYTEDPSTLWKPTFVANFPTDTSPLTKSSPTRPGVTEKWDLYVRGFELATAYSELNDPVVQRKRLVEQARQAGRGDEESMLVDEDFLEAMSYGMPPAGGMGMGIDRLLIAMTGLTIRDTITFPLVKPL
ncbi:MAG: lysine--tRNA ligase [Aeriscardovia sp.]|nr:lysine--tRNA ligase [Aeriscardovia sp.]